MRILYHHRTQAEDGQAIHIRSLIGAFEAQGHVVHEVGLVKQAQREAAAAGPPKRSSWGWVTRLPRFARELAEYGYNGIARRRIVGEAARFEPDFIYERYAFGNASGVLGARKLHLPLLLEVNSPMVLELLRTRGLSFPNLARKLETFIFRSADRVCVVSEVLRDMLLEMGVERGRLLVTPNGVDLGLYDYGDRLQTRRAARIDLGLPEEEDGGAVLGFVGYYRDWHRLDLALRSLTRPGLERARLVLIGEGPARESLERAAHECGVTGRVHFASPRAHGRIPALLPAFDVALIPAINRYASPLKLHEYMAAGLAVIAPDQPNLREVLEHKANALLVEPGDEQALGDAIEELANGDVLRAQLGAAAHQTILDRDLTWPGNARRVLRAVEELG